MTTLLVLRKSSFARFTTRLRSFAFLIPFFTCLPCHLRCLRSIASTGAPIASPRLVACARARPYCLLHGASVFRRLVRRLGARALVALDLVVVRPGARALGAIRAQGREREQRVEVAEHGGGLLQAFALGLVEGGVERVREHRRAVLAVGAGDDDGLAIRQVLLKLEENRVRRRELHLGPLCEHGRVERVERVQVLDVRHVELLVRRALLAPDDARVEVVLVVNGAEQQRVHGEIGGAHLLHERAAAGAEDGALDQWHAACADDGFGEGCLAPDVNRRRRVLDSELPYWEAFVMHAPLRPHVRDHQPLDRVAHAHDAHGPRAPHREERHERRDGGRRERAPAAPTPAARVVRRCVHQRQVGEHQLEPALLAEGEPREAGQRVQRERAVGPAVLRKVHERRGDEQHRDGDGRQRREAARGVDGRPLARRQIGRAVRAHHGHERVQDANVEIVHAHGAARARNI